MAAEITRRVALSALGLGSGAALVGCSDEAEEPTQSSSTTFRTGEDTGSGEGSGDGSSSASGSGSDGSGSSSPQSDGSPSSGTAVTVDSLPSPEEMRDPWAAYAAAWVATQSTTGVPSGVYQDADWYYASQLGEFAFLVRYKDGRAVLIGSSDPSLNDRSADDEQQARAVLTAGRPAWWAGAFEHVPVNTKAGFLCAWDGSSWKQNQRSTARGGVESMELVVTSPRETGEALVMLGTGGEEEYTGSRRSAADAVVDAGPSVTAAELTDLGPQVRHADDGVRAAKAFTDSGTH